MAENQDDLKILLTAALDLTESLATIKQQLNTLQSQLQRQSIKLTAELDKALTRAKINEDITKLKTSRKVKISGQLDRAATQKELRESVAKLKEQRVKIQGVLDRAATARNLREQMQGIKPVQATATVKTDGTEQVEDLRRKMDAAGGSAGDMAAKLYLARTALQLLRRTASETVQAIKELDEAATNLAIITGGQSAETYKMIEQYNQLARELGATTIQISDAAAAWLRQGKSAAETAQLVEQSLILSKTAMIDSATATKNLTSAMKGYDLEVQDVSSIVDKLASLDSRAAVTAQDLAEAMSRTASSANLAGVQMDRLLGYITAVEETTQASAQEVGTSMRTILARIGNVKVGKFIDDETDEPINDIEAALAKVGIALRDANGNFRDFDKVLDEVGAKWKTLTNIEQAALATTIAGTRQRNFFITLMEHYGDALNYAGIAAESSGVALQKFAAYEDSIAAKAASFTATLEGLALDTVDTELVKDLIDAAAAVVDFTDKIGLLKAALISLGVGGALKGVQTMATGVKAVTNNLTNMGEAVTMIRRVGDASKLTGSDLTRLGVLTKGMSDTQLKAVLTTRQLSAEQMKAILMANGLTEAEAAQKLETLGLAGAQTTAAAATGGLKAAVAGLSATIKASMASNPVGWIMLAVGAVSMLANAFDQASEKAQQAAQESYDNASAALKQASAIREAYVEYATLAGKVDRTAAEEDALKDAVDKVNTALASKSEILRTLKSDTEEYAEAVRDATHGELENALAAAREELQAAKDVLSGLSYSGWDGSKITIDLSGRTGIEEFVAALETAEKVMGEFFDEGMYGKELEPIGWDSNKSDMDAVVAYYYNLLELKKQLALQNNTENDIYERATEITNSLKTAVEQYVKAKLDEVSAEYELANGIPATIDALEAYRKHLGDALSDVFDFEGGGDTLAGMIEKYIGDAGFGALVEAASSAANGVADALGVVQKADVAAISDVAESFNKIYKIIVDAQAEMMRAGSVSADTIKALSEVTGDYTSYLSEENGAIRLNIDALRELASSQVTDNTDKIKAANSAYENQNDLLREKINYYEEQNKLGHDGGAWSNLIAEATTEINRNNEAIRENLILLSSYEAITNPWQDALSTFDGYSSAMEQLAKIQAEIADGFTISAEKAREFAAVYPEILNQATTAADGQITLNADVVNSFLDGKEAELKGSVEAEITKLEAEKAVLEAKKGSAQAQLDLAKNIGEGEGQIAKELAEYRINAGNAVAQAMIDAGVDEATAYKLAAEAMAQNTEEFDRVAMEVCKDIDGNFNEAAFNMAQTMFNNLKNIKSDLASVAKQAHETAQAIAGIASGKVQGSSSVVGGSGGGVAGSNIKLNLTEGSFNEHNYTFTRKQSSLEDYTAQLELDVSKYADAIATIDSQIALLRSLGNKNISDFGSNKSGSGSKSGKEADAYTVDIDRFREALQRLSEAEKERERIETELSRTHSLDREIELRDQLTQALEKEQTAMHALNEERDAAIHESVDKLTALGFEVEYDDVNNKLWIKNLEHVNELTDRDRESTNTLIKSIETLIETTEKWNESNEGTSGDWWDREADKIQNVIDKFEAVTKLYENKITLTENWLDNAVGDMDYSKVREYTDNIAEYYRRMQENIAAEAAYYRSKGYSDESDEVSKLSDLWWDYEKKRLAVTEEAWDKIVQAAHEGVDKIQDVYDKFHAAAKEFAENGGQFISIDTYQAILQLGAQYMQFLRDENGLLTITDEKIEKIMAAKTEELAIEQALAYIEKLRIALSEKDTATLEHLLYATSEAASSTWDLVYANLALLDLDEDQYRAALHNINALRSLAYTAVQSIGKVAGESREELEKMKSGVDDILKYVMDMLRSRIQQQIQDLEDMKTAYAEVVEEQKEMLRQTKKMDDYHKSLNSKLKEAAKLQAQIDALRLDTSREAQAKRIKLEEQLAELQDDIADTQREHAIEVTEDQLDEQKKAYEQEKDAEIKILEDSISSTEKLYQMALDYIRDHWSTLKDELIQWNYDVGTSLQSELESAWEAALAAAQRYGDYLTALSQIETDIAAASGSGHYDNVGQAEFDDNTGYQTERGGNAAKESAVKGIVAQMKGYSAQWSRSNDDATNQALHTEAAKKAAELDQYGVHAEYDKSKGTWTITKDDLNPSNIGKLLYNVYHQGGIVGGGSVKANEQFALLKKDEWVLTEEMADKIGGFLKMYDKLQNTFVAQPYNVRQELLSDMAGGALSSVTNTNRNVTVSFGDTIINGGSAETVRRHQEISREQANKVLKYLNIHKQDLF